MAAVDALAAEHLRGMFAPSPADFVADAKADPVIERGRYLVEGLATAALAIPRAASPCRKKR